MCGTLPGWSDISPPPGSWLPFRPALERSNKVDGPLIRLLPVRRATHPIRQCTALSARSSIASLLNKVDGPLIRLLPVQRATHPIRRVPIGPAVQNPPPADPPPAGPPNRRPPDHRPAVRPDRR